MTNQTGENIRRARINKNMSQQELAQAIKVDRSTISGWETGKRAPDTDMLKLLCAVLDVPIMSIIGENEQIGEIPCVIILDDEKVILDYNAMILRQVMPTAEVVSFTRPSDAIAYAKQRFVDLALLDIEMGKISGLDVCRELLKINKKTAVLYLTAYMEYSFDAWATGASGFLLKPLNAETVRTQLSMLKSPLKGYE